MSLCPVPLLDANGGNDGLVEDTGCAIPCTGTMHTAAEINEFYRLQLVVSAISLVLIILCNATWGMFTIKAKQKMTFWVTTTSLCVSLCIFFPLAFGGDGPGTWCLNEVTPLRQENGLSGCILQGMSLVFFGLSLCCWWWCSCFDLFSKLYRRKRNIEHYLSYYHIFSWGLPLVCTLAIVISNEFGFKQPRLWCFLSPDAADFYEYLFFYGWIGVLWITGTIMFILTFVSIFSGSSHSNNKKNTYWKKLKIYRVPLVFVVIFSFFWAIFAAFTLYANFNEDRLRESAILWSKCLFGDLEQFPNPAVEASPEGLDLLFPDAAEQPRGCGFVQPDRVPPILFYLAVLALSGNGILLFLIFFLQQQNFQLWYRYISSGFNPRSVKPRQRAGASTNKPQYSSYQEIRRSIAKGSIFLCEEFGGLREGERKRYETNVKPSYVQNPKWSSAGEEDVHPENFPRVTYQQKPPSHHNASHGSNDPFPLLSTPAIPRETVGESILNPNTPREPEHFYSSARRRVSTADWSDIYDDPLWGNNVEF